MHNNDPLLETLQRWETALHTPSVRSDSAQLEQLLHPCFSEFGRSGTVIDRAECLQSMLKENTSTALYSQNFRLDQLSHDIALLRYQSYQLSTTGESERHSNRSSLWQHTDTGWQLRFHQGTATGAFALVDG